MSVAAKRALLLAAGAVSALATVACGFDAISLESPAPAEQSPAAAGEAAEAARSSPYEQPREGLTGDAAPGGYAASRLHAPSPDSAADGRRDEARLRRLHAKQEAANAVRRELAALNRAKYGSDLGAAPAGAPASGTAPQAKAQASLPQAEREPATAGDDGVRRRMLEAIAGQEPAGSRPPGPAARQGATPASPPSAATSFNIQVMALSTRAAVDESWRVLQARHGDLFAGRGLVIDPVELPEKGLLYRLQVGPFPGRETADRICRSLQARGQDCFVVKS